MKAKPKGNITWHSFNEIQGKIKQKDNTTSQGGKGSPRKALD